MKTTCTKHIAIVAVIATMAGLSCQADEPQLKLHGKAVLVCPIMLGKPSDDDDAWQYAVNFAESLCINAGTAGNAAQHITPLPRIHCGRGKPCRSGETAARIAEPMENENRLHPVCPFRKQANRQGIRSKGPCGDDGCHGKDRVVAGSQEILKGREYVAILALYGAWPDADCDLRPQGIR